jgi:hypothetical protein
VPSLQRIRHNDEANQFFKFSQGDLFMVPQDRLAPSSNGAPKKFVSDAEQLLAQFQQIEQVWKRAEEMLSATRVPVDVRVSLNSGRSEHGDYGFATFLSYEKVKGTRRICLVREDYDYGDGSTEVDCRPIVEQPVNVRVEMFDQYERLYKEATAVAKSYIPKLEAAINKFGGYLDLLDL